MDIKTLEQKMIANGLVIRAIPLKIISHCEVRYIDKYPTGIVHYNEKYKRNMLKVERIPKNAGKFIFEQNGDTSSMIRFTPNGKYYDSIEDLIRENEI